MTYKVKIGFAGLGNLGTALAKQIDAEHGLHAVWSRTEKNCHFASTQKAKTLEDLCHSVDWIFSCVADDDALAAITDQIKHAQNRPKIHVSFATCSPAQVQKSAECHQAVNVRFVNAPVLGRPDLVEARKASILLAGDIDAISTISPCLQSISSSVLDLGANPCLSAATKLCINYLVACHIAGLSEALSAMTGVENGETALLRVLESSPLDSPVMRLFSHAISNRKFTPVLFDLRLAAKDLDYFRSLAAPATVTHVATGIRAHMEQSGHAIDHPIDWTGLAAHLFEPAT